MYIKPSSRSPLFKLNLKSVFEHGKHLFGVIGDELFYFNKNVGKKTPSEYIVASSNSMLNRICFDKKDHTCHVSINVSIKDMRKMMKKMESQQKTFKKCGYFVHLSPDISFFVPHKNKLKNIIKL